MLRKLSTWVYTCQTEHYIWSSEVRAPSIKAARIIGRREALRVMGNHATITSDEVKIVNPS